MTQKKLLYVLIFLSLLQQHCVSKIKKTYKLQHNRCLDDLDEPKIDISNYQDLTKVLIIPKEFVTNFVAYFIKEFMEALENKGWTVIPMEDIIQNPDAKIKEIIKSDKDPDILAFYILRQGLLGQWSTLHKNNSIKILITEDIHYDYDKQPFLNILPNLDAVFSRYPEAMLAVSTDSQQENAFKCFNLYQAAGEVYDQTIHFSEKKGKLLISGATAAGYYPLRQHAKNLMQQETSLPIEVRPHPGYDPIRDAKRESTEYSQNINNYKLALAGTAPFPEKTPGPYLIAKHFEIPASGTAMITDEIIAPYLASLGFEENKHYITATVENLKDKVLFWLADENQDQLLKITRAGQALVKQHHTIKIRASTFDKIAHMNHVDVTSKE